MWGGTIAYLQGETSDIVNEFKTNKVMVDLTETTGDYNIIPGTVEKKDPKVTVDNTVDAYVFVEVTDTTQNLVDYTIADGWTELADFGTETVKVYYREVKGDADVNDKSFSVLQNDEVRYDAALENKDMFVKNTTSLKSSVKLSFKAYAIQQKPFESVEAAYVAQPKSAADAKELGRALSLGSPVALSGDIQIGRSFLEKNLNSNSQIDLNGKTLTIAMASDVIDIAEGRQLTIKNGTIESNGKTYAFDIHSGSSLTFENVTYNTKAEFGVGGVAQYATDTTFNIIDSDVTVEGCMIISTNASKDSAGNVSSGAKINVKNSKLTITENTGDCVGILLNVPGTLNIENSTITADRQAVVVRGGDAVIKDSSLVCTGKFLETDEHKETDNGYTTLPAGETWGSGNEVPARTLVVGNISSSGAYAYPASCTLVNTTLTSAAEIKPVLAAACNGYPTTVTGVADENIDIIKAAGTDTVNIINSFDN